MQHRNCTDSTAILISAQGHQIMHLGCYFMNLILQSRFQSKTLNVTCMSYTSNDPMTAPIQSDKNLTEFMTYNQQIGNIHLVCFILLSLSNILDSFSIHAHFSMLFSLTTIPLYIYIILIIQDCMFKILDYYKQGCLGNSDLSSIDEWFAIELSIFYSNLLSLFFYLLRKILFGKSFFYNIKEEDNDKIIGQMRKELSHKVKDKSGRQPNIWIVNDYDPKECREVLEVINERIEKASEECDVKSKHKIESLIKNLVEEDCQ